jgi:Gas vesicle synthesis protein GvpL/GvpF
LVADGHCLWLYAVAGDADGPFPAGVTGVGGAAARPLRAAGFVAVVARVDESEFGADALHRNLEDLDWLERTARAHHAVIEAVAGTYPVVPARLATVYSSAAAVEEMLHERAADFRQALARIAERSEWGVKAFVATPADPDGPSGSPAEGSGRAAPAPGTGAAYLQRRREQLTARQDARREAVVSAQTVDAELARLSVSARRYPPQAPDLAGRSATMVLNAAYLVADERADDFVAAVSELAARHPAVQLTLTGPWPAYSFAAPDGEAEVRR